MRILREGSLKMYAQALSKVVSTQARALTRTTPQCDCTSPGVLRLWGLFQWLGRIDGCGPACVVVWEQGRRAGPPARIGNVYRSGSARRTGSSARMVRYG